MQDIKFAAQESGMLEHFNRVLKDTSKPLFHKAKAKKRLERLLNEANEYAKACEFCNARCGQPLPKPKVFCSKGWGKEPLAFPALQLYFADGTQNDLEDQKPENSVQFLTPAAVAAWVDRNAKAQKSIVISGNPAHFIPFIISILAKTRPKLPIVLYTHPYFSEVASAMFKPLIDLYVFTFAFSDPVCSQHLVSKDDYPSAARRVCSDAEKSGDVIVHVPVMPAHLECDAKETIRWIANNMGDCAVRILKNWEPQIISPELTRRPTITELNDVAKTAYRMDVNILEE